MAASQSIGQGEETLLPAMRKLEDALQFAGEGTGKIHTILREAEEEAARLFRGEGTELPSDDSTPFVAQSSFIRTDNNAGGDTANIKADKKDATFPPHDDDSSQVTVNKRGCIEGISVNGTALTPTDTDKLYRLIEDDTVGVLGEKSYVPWSVFNTQTDSQRQEMLANLQRDWDRRLTGLYNTIKYDQRIYLDARWKGLISAIGIDPALEDDGALRLGLLVLLTGTILYLSGGTAAVVAGLGGYTSLSMVGSTGYALLDEFIEDLRGKENQVANAAEIASSAHERWLQSYLDEAHSHQMNDLRAVGNLMVIMKRGMETSPMATVSGLTYFLNGQPHIVVVDNNGSALFQGPVSSDMARILHYSFRLYGEPC